MGRYSYTTKAIIRVRSGNIGKDIVGYLHTLRISKDSAGGDPIGRERTIHERQCPCCIGSRRVHKSSGTHRL